MTGEAVICCLGEHVPIEGADRIVQCFMMGDTIITQTSTEPGTLGILFDCETQLSHDFCFQNNLYSSSELNSDKTVTGYIGKNRRIRPIKLKGVRCSAMFMPIDSVSYLGDFSGLDEGTQFTELANNPICCKYEVKRGVNTPKGGSIRKDYTPTFREHLSTEHLGRSADKLRQGNLITVTEKLHGTSGRCANLQTVTDNRSWIDKLLGRTKNAKVYDTVVGSRKVVKSIGFKALGDKDHYYASDIWTKVCKENFEGKLIKGETVYFELVGYTPEGGHIMDGRSTEALKQYMNKKEYTAFTKRYGKEINFSYGNEVGEYGIYLYRVTTTNEDGKQIDLPWANVKRRAEELGVGHVPEITQYIYDSQDTKEFIRKADVAINAFASTNFPFTVPEGFCYRIDNGGDTPIILKQKSFIFKALEGILRDDDIANMEEEN